MSEREGVKIRRYDACEMDYIAERENGDYVKYEDYIAQLTTAEREREEAREELERERLRLAACGVAARGDSRSVNTIYTSDSLKAVVALRHRAERAEAVVEAAKVYEQLHVKLIAEGASERYPSRVFDDLCIELDVAANNLCAALRALDAAEASDATP